MLHCSPSAEFSDVTFQGDSEEGEEEGEEVTSPGPHLPDTLRAATPCMSTATAAALTTPGASGQQQGTAASAAAAVAFGGAVPGGRVLKVSHDAPGTPVKISLHLERQARGRGPPPGQEG